MSLSPSAVRARSRSWAWFSLATALLWLGPSCSAGKGGKDADGDGHSGDEDCDDADPNVHADAVELCDGLDNDCDGVIDEDAIGGTTWYVDDDGDNHGTTAATVFACDQPEGYSAVSDDCDDGDASRFPTNPEVCDEVDNDCDEDIDEGVLQGLFLDDDADGYGNPEVSVEGCAELDGWVFDNTDCDDANGDISPGADEICNEVDDNCDGLVDNDAVDASTLAVDADGDGLGQPGSASTTCEGVDNEWDCDDVDPTEPQVVDAVLGSETGDGSLAAPLLTIQAGIDAATACVVVLAGTYPESLDFGGRAISVTGVQGADSTIIDATGLGQPVARFDSAETADSVLQGFTLTGGSGVSESTSVSTACTSVTTCTDYFETWCGGGLYVQGADPTLIDLLVSANSLPPTSYLADGDDQYFVYSYGGGACMLDSTATLTGVRLSENFADQGGGLYIDELSAVTVSQLSVFANAATDGAGGMVDGGAMLANNVLSAWNVAGSDGGGLLVLDGVASLLNATIAYETATAGGGIYLSGSSTVRLMNSIVASTSAEGVLVDGSSAVVASYDDVWVTGPDWVGLLDPTGFDGNISEDPLFSSVTDDGDWTDDDWSLAEGSPAIDAGHPDAVYADVDGSDNDMGAFGGPAGEW